MSAVIAVPEADSRLGWGAVLTLAWPIMVSMASLNALALVDSVVVGQLGTAPLAGVGIAMPATYLALAVGVGLADGVRVVTSQRVGAGDAAAVARLGVIAVVVSVLAGLPGLLLSPWSGALLQVFGATAEVADAGSAYLFWRVAGAPCALALLAVGALAQGRGDTRAHMVGNLVANLVNLVLTPLMALGFAGWAGWGVAGAAIATVIGQAAGVVVLLWRQRAVIARVLPDRALLAEVWRVGWPLGAHHLVEIASWTVFVALLARAGQADLAAHVLVVRIVMLSFLPGLAVAQATSVLVGQAVGARRSDRALEAVRSGMGLAVTIMLVGGIVIAVAPGPLLGIFAPEPDVVVVARQLLWVGAAFQVIDAIATVALCALAGAGDTRANFLIGVGASWAVKVPLAAVLVIHLDLGALGAWLGLTGEIAVVAGLGLWRIASGGWLRAAERTAASV